MDSVLESPNQTGLSTERFSSELLPVIPLLSVAKLTLLYTYILPVSVAIAIGGVFTNIVNILVFFKMGLHSTSNINFFTLAIADLLCVAYAIPAFTFLHPWVDEVLWNFSFLSLFDFLYPFFIAYCAFGSWVTTIISVERACCIAFPLKVGSL